MSKKLLMNKNSTPRQKPSSKKSTPRSENNTDTIHGFYKIKRGEHFVDVDGKLVPVSYIEKSVKGPIAYHAKVSGIMKGKGKKSAFVITHVEAVLKPSLKNLIHRFLVDNKVRLEFPSDALKEASKFGDTVNLKEIGKRTDLSALALCTIDGETAKDFDDAVFARMKGKNIEVFVAIADVSYYVREGSALDEEALARSTSIYYPGSCIPMLPEALSNGLCSLKPNVHRLAIAVSFELGPKGGVSKPKIQEVVIKSHARLTYTEVQRFYDGSFDSAISKPLSESLLLLRTAAHILRKARHRRGAIDFDVVESLIALDSDGEPLAIHPQDRLDAHRIIEDLMVATNEIVAEYAEDKDLPNIFRVHEPPNSEKLSGFFDAAKAFNALSSTVKTRAESITEPKDIQELMESYQKSPYRETLNTLMLRSMMQARYSAENLMHFGLASVAYSHFTSPIRRYADLVVHRQLRNVVFEKNYRAKLSESFLAKVATHISDMEVKATDMERKIHRYFASTFMSKRVGDVFDAVIVACTEFGFFVRVAEFHVEGLVHIATIADSRVIFVPEKMTLVVSGSNKRFMVGDKVKVKLLKVNVERGHIDFVLNKEMGMRTDRDKGHPARPENAAPGHKVLEEQPAKSDRKSSKTKRPGLKTSHKKPSSPSSSRRK